MTAIVNTGASVSSRWVAGVGYCLCGYVFKQVSGACCVCEWIFVWAHVCASSVWELHNRLKRVTFLWGATLQEILKNLVSELAASRILGLLNWNKKTRTVQCLMSYLSSPQTHTHAAGNGRDARGHVGKFIVTFFLLLAIYIYGQRVQVNILLFYSLRRYASEDTQCSCHHSQHYDVNRLYRQRSEIIKLIRNQVNSRVMLIK